MTNFKRKVLLDKREHLIFEAKSVIISKIRCGYSITIYFRDGRPSTVISINTVKNILK